MLVESQSALTKKLDKLVTEVHNHVIEQQKMLVECSHRRESALRLEERVETVCKRTTKIEDFIKHFRGGKAMVVGIITAVILVTTFLASAETLYNRFIGRDYGISQTK